VPERVNAKLFTKSVPLKLPAAVGRNVTVNVKLPLLGREAGNVESPLRAKVGLLELIVSIVAWLDAGLKIRNCAEAPPPASVTGNGIAPPGATVTGDWPGKI